MYHRWFTTRFLNETCREILTIRCPIATNITSAWAVWGEITGRQYIDSPDKLYLDLLEEFQVPYKIKHLKAYGEYGIEVSRNQSRVKSSWYMLCARISTYLSLKREIGDIETIPDIYSKEFFDIVTRREYSFLSSYYGNIMFDLNHSINDIVRRNGPSNYFYYSQEPFKKELTNYYRQAEVEKRIIPVNIEELKEQQNDSLPLWG